MGNILQLSLLGSLRIVVGAEQSINLPTRKEEALLAYLAVEHAHAHSRESLAGLLWPDSPPDKARLSLRVNLSKLKKRLRPADVDALFRITSLDIRFLVHACHLDVAVFTQALRSGERHGHRREELCEECQPAFSRAVDLYQGAFLDGFYLDACQTFEEWLFIQRERFRVQTLDALEKLTAFHFRRNETNEALAYARRQLEIDPLLEQAHVQIMQIHLAHGDRAGALRQYERCCALLRSELGVEPSDEMRELYQQMMAAPTQRIVPSAPPIADTPKPGVSRLPVYLTPFVGRQDELSLLDERIGAGDYRLITLMGAGGVGKTRLAVEAARRQSDRFAGNVYFVPCAGAEGVSAMLEVFAAALEITFRADGESPQNQLIAWLQPHRALFIVDNFEHIRDGAPLLAQILHAAPAVVMLVTSREPLGVQAEDLIHVTGLPVPGAEERAEIARFASVHLFVDRAYRVNKRFHLNGDNAADVARICRLTAGLPLALELAAAQTSNHTCRAIADAIAADLTFLQAELPDLEARHRSIAAVFEQSWQSLSALEQSCFSRLSIFRNPFTAAAASAVAGASLATLTRLQRVNLLQRHDDFEYFSIHELLRQFATTKLTQSLPNPSTLQRRHAEYFLTGLLLHQPMVEGIQSMRHVASIQAVYDDVRAAWQWASSSHAVDLLQRALPALATFFALRGAHREGELHFREALIQLNDETGEDDRLRGQFLAHLGASMESQGKVEAARDALDRSIAIARRLTDHQTVGCSLLTLARLLVSVGEIPHAVQQLESGLAMLPEGEFLAVRTDLLLYLFTLEGHKLLRESSASRLEEARRLIAQTGNKVQEQRLHLHQAIHNTAHGNEVAARFYFERALALSAETGNQALEARIHTGLGFTLARLGDYEAAIHHHERGLALAIADRDLMQQSYTLHNLCVCHDAQGNVLEAYRCGQEALAIAERHRLNGAAGYAQLHLGHVLARMHLYHEAYQSFASARNVFVQSGELALEVETEAGIAHVSRLLGDLPGALARVERVLEYLQSHTLAGCDEPSRIYLHCYQVLRACDDERAAGFLNAAYRDVQRRAAPLDPEACARFLNVVAANRQIVELWQEQLQEL